MLNKMQFNNMVISNKKGIQQARIQTINKLVHKIRKLKTLLEKRPDDKKCKERIRKSTETMEQLKKFKRVDIMKNILLLEKPPAAVITNGMSTPEEMATALLAMNKVMQGLSKRFKLELQLEDASNSSWRDELKESSKRKQKIERTEEKKRKRTALKEQKAVARKRQEWLEQNCQADAIEETPTKSEDTISTVNGWKIEEIEMPSKEEAKDGEVYKKESSIITNQLKRPREDKKPQKVSNENPKKKQQIDAKKKQIAKFGDNSPTEKEFDQSNIQERLISDEEEVVTETHVVDPFFVTETGENYLSTAVSKAQDDLSEREDQKDLHMIKLNGTKMYQGFRERKQQHTDKYPQRQNQRNNNKYTQNQSKWNGEKQQHRPNKWSDSKQTQNSRSDQNNWKNPNGSVKRTWERQPDNATTKPSYSAKADVEEKLHPSWAAKQKLKPVITNFQGKKITFGDGDNNTNIPLKNTNNNRNDQQSQKTSTDSIHPSWAAKQKQKPTITAFQGKKICFDNDD